MNERIAAAIRKPFREIIEMKKLATILSLALAVSVTSSGVYAQSPAAAPAAPAAAAPAASPTCTFNASEKKLAGAAKNSFMKKCETDAKASCDKQAADKKIFGAAKNSFTKKCVADSVGA